MAFGGDDEAYAAAQLVVAVGTLGSGVGAAVSGGRSVASSALSTVDDVVYTSPAGVTGAAKTAAKAMDPVSTDVLNRAVMPLYSVGGTALADYLH